MPEEEAAEFERHCDACQQCAAILVRKLAIMGMMRLGDRGLLPEQV
jgi:hypothetical protein